MAAAQDDLVRAVREAGVADERVLAAFREIPRAMFVPPELAASAYVDAPLPIPHGQVTTQPSLVGRMLEALAPRESDVVLELGTGYGFQTALLTRLARFVWSVERFDDVAETAQRNLRAIGAVNAEVVVGDGSAGLPGRAPFDAILVSAAFPSVPDPLADQLAEGGRLVQPIGAGGNEDVVLFQKRSGRLAALRTVSLAHFVRLYGEHGFSE
jgi:protein-L-isoaspartate(D-aspartate) O-methyltransferase